MSVRGLHIDMGRREAYAPAPTSHVSHRREVILQSLLSEEKKQLAKALVEMHFQKDAPAPLRLARVRLVHCPLLSDCFRRGLFRRGVVAT